MVPSGAAAAPPPFLETLGSAEEPSFTDPLGMAVDQSTGALLVIDGEANTVSRWNPDGTPADFSALGTNVIDGAAGGADETPQGGLTFGTAAEVQVAVDNSGGANDGNIYVPQAGAQTVDVFGEDGTFLGQLTESSGGTFSEPCGVAVDPDGNLYVGDFSGQIHKYEPAAKPPVNGDNSANFPFSGNCTLAAGTGPSNGSLFAAHFLGATAKLNSETGAEEYEVDAGPTTTLGVNPANGHLFVATEEEVAEYDASGAASATDLPPAISLPTFARGVAVDGSSGTVYVTRGGYEHVEVFAEAPLENLFELSVETVGSGSGTVTSMAPNTGIDCGSECSAEFEEGMEVELEATPASNSEFTGWTTAAGSSGTCTGTTSPCLVTIAEAVELEAEFTRNPPIVTSIRPARGSAAGGNVIEITGLRLSEATKVEFGTIAVAAPFIENTETTIKLKAPVHKPGKVDVRVTTAGGTSGNSRVTGYVFIGPPSR